MHRQARILVIDDDDTGSRAMKLDAADFLAKSVTLEDLTASIRTCLERAGHKSAAGRDPRKPIELES